MLTTSKGETFVDLTAYMIHEERRQRRCKHSKVRFTYLVTGLLTGQPHLSVGSVCRTCKKVVDSVRVKISYEEAERLYPGN